jgi:hypothetical protein
MLMVAIQGVLNALGFEVIAGFYGVNIFLKILSMPLLLSLLSSLIFEVIKLFRRYIFSKRAV